MSRLATLATAIALVASLAAPFAALAADPIADGAVRLGDGRVLPPMPADLLQPGIHAEMLDGIGRGAFDFGRPDPAASDGRAPDWAHPTPIGPPGQTPAGTGGAVGRTASQVAPSTYADAASLPNGLRKEVFGFLPYWQLTDSALASLNYRLVSTIAYFGVAANKDGYLVKTSGGTTSTGWAGWTSARMSSVIDQAHDADVRVVLTVTMMAWDSTSTQHMATFLGSSTARSRLVGEVVAAVRDRGADGVNLDFEPVPSSLRAQYTSFVAQMKSGLASAGVGDYLTVCVMAGSATWATGYDVAGLTAAGAADALFVMGYDYHWSGSSRAGGVAPIESPYTLDVSGTMSDFLELTAGSKLIWGVPYYGRTWPTSSDQLNATTLGGGSKAYYYTGHLAQAAQYGRRWDDVGKVPWYRWYDAAAGHWTQGYYDDVESLGVKYDLVNARGLAGTGMWTLLMDAGRDDLWRLLADRFVTDSAAPVGGVALLPESSDDAALRVSWRILDYASGLDRVDVQFREIGTTTWRAWLTGTQADAAWFIGDPGVRYAFRAAGIDWKGNRQAWIELPAAPSTLGAGAFARVVVASLNLRAGAGTGQAILGTLPEGSLLRVLEGPVSANGYQWWRVQHSFTEWPSADFPRIGWVAEGAGADPYLATAQPPNRTRFDPFVAGVAMPAQFSPNGDGRQDAVSVAFRLRGAASGVRLEVLNANGAVVRSLELGAHASGPMTASWDGRLSGGGWAPAGRYLLRVRAVDAGGAVHYAPTDAFDDELLAALGITADLQAPGIDDALPASGGLAAVTSRVVVDFTEPMTAVPHGLTLRRADGSLVPASVGYDPGARRAYLVPASPLARNASYSVQLASGRDLAGNPLAPASWSFFVAPGAVFDPPRSGVLSAGSHTGYVIGSGATLLDARAMTLASAEQPRVTQRATLPNLPGRWLATRSGSFRHLWLREAPGQALAGEAERTSYPSETRISFAAGTHVGYRFDAAGRVTASLSAALGAASSANTAARAIIGGRAYLLVTNGIWAGYWMPESPAACRKAIIERLSFPGGPTVTFAAGTYTGATFDAAGNQTGSLTATLTHASNANASAWAVINGRAYFLIANGIWAGRWVPEGSGLGIHVGA